MTQLAPGFVWCGNQLWPVEIKKERTMNYSLEQETEIVRLQRDKETLIEECQRLREHIASLQKLVASYQRDNEVDYEEKQ
jgi:hypothetical protein